MTNIGASNPLLREYFPKATDPSVHTIEDLADVAADLSTRPRKSLGWKTPASVFATLAET